MYVETRTAGRIYGKVVCDTCGTEVAWAGHRSCFQTAAVLREEGWSMGNYHTCPKCLAVWRSPEAAKERRREYEKGYRRRRREQARKRRQEAENE